MKKSSEVEIFIRYFVLLILGLNIRIFYFLFAPPTIFFLKMLLGMSYDVSQYENLIFFDGTAIEIIEACIAASAYYLLAILNITTRCISIKKRLKIFFFTTLVFLFFNITRIYILAILYAKNILFYFAHLFFLYFVSFFLVLGIWILAIKIFDIREIPVWSDFCFIRRKAGKKKLSKRQAGYRKK